MHEWRVEAAGRPLRSAERGGCAGGAAEAVKGREELRREEGGELVEAHEEETEEA